jgi:hypothetical protein
MSTLLYALSPAIDRAERVALAQTFYTADSDEVESIT